MSYRSRVVTAAALFVFAVLILLVAVLAVVDHSVPLLTVTGKFLFGLFSYPLFLIPPLMFFTAAVLLTNRFPQKEGLIISGLSLLPILLLSLWVQLLTGPKAGGFFYSIEEGIVSHYGNAVFVVYLCFLLIAILIGLMAPIRVALMVLDLKVDESENILIPSKKREKKVKPKREKRKKNKISFHRIQPSPDLAKKIKKSIGRSQEAPLPSEELPQEIDLPPVESFQEKSEEEEGLSLLDQIEKEEEAQRQMELDQIPAEELEEDSFSIENKTEDVPVFVVDEDEVEESIDIEEDELISSDFLEEEELSEEEDEVDFEEQEKALAKQKNPKALEINIDEGSPAETSSWSGDEKKTSSARKRKGKYRVPVEAVLTEHENAASWQVDEETKQKGQLLQQTLEEFKIQAEVTGIQKGPVITMFEILPAPGVKLSKIVTLSDNIALRLAASSVRIVAPIPGKHAVGIEIPNEKRALVSFKEMVEDKKFSDKGIQIPVILGKNITGTACIIDLTQTPHLLIAGATGSGKSVCVNSLITSILYRRRPDEVKLMLIDPKIVELKLYNDIPHLLTPVITEPKRAFQALNYCLSEMERRYSLLDSVGCRDIKSFNEKIKEEKIATEKLPYIVVIVDELADLMATTGKELEATLARLAAMSRAVGIHLVLATQRPSIDVITGIIKANFPSRIAFMVASKVDSRTILDSNGADKLLGKGDMLFSPSWDPIPIRIQGSYISDREVENVVAHVKSYGEPEYIDDEIFIDDEDGNLGLFSGDAEDPLMNKALEVVMMTGKASASYLQRRMKIGYNRAARLIEEMEARGIVGPQNGSKPRDVLMNPDQLD